MLKKMVFGQIIIAELPEIFEKAAGQFCKRSAGVDSFHDGRRSSCFLSALPGLTPDAR